MGLFSSSTPAEAGAPTRSARQVCWTARDAYFGCLEGNAVNVPGQEEKGVCKKEKEAYGKGCAASWVSGLWGSMEVDRDGELSGRGGGWALGGCD